jgi:small subunit ribosomal protein S26e
MGKKRKSGGRSKGGKGSLGKVQCSSCGRLVPRDKAKRKTSYKSCVSCAIHRHQVKIRSADERKSRR